VSEKFIHEGGHVQALRCQVLDTCVEVPDNAPIAMISKIPSLKITGATQEAVGSTWPNSTSFASAAGAGTAAALVELMKMRR
jgi:hypothetical protein